MSGRKPDGTRREVKLFVSLLQEGSQAVTRDPYCIRLKRPFCKRTPSTVCPQSQQSEAHGTSIRPLLRVRQVEAQHRF